MASTNVSAKVASNSTVTERFDGPLGVLSKQSNWTTHYVYSSSPSTGLEIDRFFIARLQLNAGVGYDIDLQDLTDRENNVFALASVKRLRIRPRLIQAGAYVDVTPHATVDGWVSYILPGGGLRLLCGDVDDGTSYPHHDLNCPLAAGYAVSPTNKVLVLTPSHNMLCDVEIIGVED